MNEPLPARYGHASLLLRRLPQITERIKQVADAELLLCRPSIGELWFMVFNSTQVEANEVALKLFLHDFVQVEDDENSAVEFGRIKTELRKAGKMIPDVDIQIAAITRTSGVTLLTDDAHFSSVLGVQIENWLR